FEGSFDYISAIIAILAIVALFKFNQSVLRVIIGSALLGLVIKLII
ncbi:MAG: chromate transporter, partial [Acinetobacter sp.]